MEIHPRTVAATYRTLAREQGDLAKLAAPMSYDHAFRQGVQRGLELAAEDMERRADAEFDRIMAEHPQLPGERPSEYAARITDVVTGDHPVRP